MKLRPLEALRLLLQVGRSFRRVRAEEHPRCLPEGRGTGEVPMSIHEYLTEEPDKMRLGGLRILARIIAEHLLTQPGLRPLDGDAAQASDSAVSGVGEDERRTTTGRQP